MTTSKSLQPLVRQVKPASRIAGAGAAVIGIVMMASALVTPQPDLRAWLIANGADAALTQFVLLVAGAILWSFGGMSLAIAGVRSSQIFNAFTMVCGMVGLVLGFWLLLAPARFAIVHAAGGCAVLAGAVLTGGGVVACALATRTRSKHPPLPGAHPSVRTGRPVSSDST